MMAAGWLTGSRALTRNNDFSCKRHHFPPARADPVAHSNVLWRSSANIALTVFQSIRGCIEGRGGEGRRASAPGLHVIVPNLVNRGSDFGRGRATDTRTIKAAPHKAHSHQTLVPSDLGAEHDCHICVRRRWQALHRRSEGEPSARRFKHRAALGTGVRSNTARMDWEREHAIR